MEPSDASNLKSSISIDPSRDQKLYPTILIPSVPCSCGIADGYISSTLSCESRFPKLLRRSSRELSRRRPSLETQSLDNYQRESMAGYSPRRCRVYEVVIYFGAQSALFGLSDDVDANNREGFLRRREAACSRAVGRVSWRVRCGRE